MYEAEINAQAAELAATREGAPAHPGAGRKSIVYSPDSMRRTFDLFHQSGRSVASFAQQAGLSQSALLRWVTDAKASTDFVSVSDVRTRTREAAYSAGPEERAPVTAALQAEPPLPLRIVVRETVLAFPRDLSPTSLREIMTALQSSTPC